MEKIPHNAQIWFNGYALQRETNKKTWDASVFLLFQSDVKTVAKMTKYQLPAFFLDNFSLINRTSGFEMEKFQV